jgi:hypothetical protein
MADILPTSIPEIDEPRARRRPYAIGAGAVVLIAIAFPLLREFIEPGRTAWNIFLALFLIGVVAAGILLQRFFAAHAGEIGAARFDTRTKSDSNG